MCSISVLRNDLSVQVRTCLLAHAPKVKILAGKACLFVHAQSVVIDILSMEEGIPEDTAPAIRPSDDTDDTTEMKIEPPAAVTNDQSETNDHSDTAETETNATEGDGETTTTAEGDRASSDLSGAKTEGGMARPKSIYLENDEGETKRIVKKASTRMTRVCDLGSTALSGIVA